MARPLRLYLQEDVSEDWCPEKITRLLHTALVHNGLFQNKMATKVSDHDEDFTLLNLVTITALLTNKIIRLDWSPITARSQDHCLNFITEKSVWDRVPVWYVFQHSSASFVTMDWMPYISNECPVDDNHAKVHHSHDANHWYNASIWFISWTQILSRR